MLELVRIILVTAEKKMIRQDTHAAVPHNLFLQVDSVLNQLSLSIPVMFSGLVTRLTSYPRILLENILNTDPISLGKYIVSDDSQQPQALTCSPQY